MTYYGAGSGRGIAFANAQTLLRPQGRIGVVGLGTGTLACYHAPGRGLAIFEIDPGVLGLFAQPHFHLPVRLRARCQGGARRCAARRCQVPRGSLDLLAVDAFSSDSIPLHLLTDEAFGVYLRQLSPRGVLLVHISNRFIELEPVLAAEAQQARTGSAQAQRQSRRSDGPDAIHLGRAQPRSGRLVALAKAGPARPGRR